MSELSNDLEIGSAGETIEMRLELFRRESYSRKRTPFWEKIRHHATR